jgi:hypothetical protein
MSEPSAHWVRCDGYLMVQIADAVMAHALPREPASPPTTGSSVRRRSIGRDDRDDSAGGPCRA